MNINNTAECKSGEAYPESLRKSTILEDTYWDENADKRSIYKDGFVDGATCVRDESIKQAIEWMMKNVTLLPGKVDNFREFMLAKISY